MKALEYKIFDVLTERITVSEFENWLYSSEYLTQQVQENTFLFDVVNINFKDEKCIRDLFQLAKEKFTEDEFIALKIISICNKIVEDSSAENYINYVKNIAEDFHYETDLNPLDEFYSLCYSYDGYEMGVFRKNSVDLVNTRAKSLAETVLNKTENKKDLVEILSVFKEESFVKKAEIKPEKMPILTKTQNKTCTIQKKLILRIKAVLFKNK